MKQHPDDRRLYADFGFAYEALSAAAAAGTLRRFRAKYRGRCCSCGENIAVGQPVASPASGKIACRRCTVGIEGAA